MNENVIDDIPERAKRIYEDQLREKLEATAMHKFVAVEPDSGNYFLGDTLSEAVAGCRAKYGTTRRTHVLRVGHEAAIHLGGNSLEWSRR